MMATANSYLASYLKQPYIGVSDELSHGVAIIVEATIGNSVEVASVLGQAVEKLGITLSRIS